MRVFALLLCFCDSKLCINITTLLVGEGNFGIQLLYISLVNNLILFKFFADSRKKLIWVFTAARCITKLLTCPSIVIHGACSSLFAFLLQLLLRWVVGHVSVPAPKTLEAKSSPRWVLWVSWSIILTDSRSAPLDLRRTLRNERQVLHNCTATTTISVWGSIRSRHLRLVHTSTRCFWLTQFYSFDYNLDMIVW